MSGKSRYQRWGTLRCYYCNAPRPKSGATCRGWMRGLNTWDVLRVQNKERRPIMAERKASHSVTFESCGQRVVREVSSLEYATVFARTHGFRLKEKGKVTFLPGTIRNSTGQIIRDPGFPPVSWKE